MVDRLRALLEEPLDARVGRAVVVLASAIVLGLAALFVLAGSGHDQPNSHGVRPAAASPSAAVAPVESTEGEAVEGRLPTRRQDPQDHLVRFNKSRTKTAR
jgi:hypothetical protein